MPTPGLVVVTSRGDQSNPPSPQRPLPLSSSFPNPCSPRVLGMSVGSCLGPELKLIGATTTCAAVLEDPRVRPLTSLRAWLDPFLSHLTLFVVAIYQATGCQTDSSALTQTVGRRTSTHTDLGSDNRRTRATNSRPVTMASSTPALEKTDLLVACTATDHTVQAPVKQQRVLACVSCQQRKIKCDRHFPCAHCLRAGISCVPAALVSRQRRRRFPERDLLQRLRHYEDLLRQNNVGFQPLHPTPPTNATAMSAEQHSAAAVKAASDNQGRGTGASEILDDTRSETSASDKPPMKLETKPV